ncbi:nucleoside triphosphate pyrophosphohydrolase [Acetonema longum]|uniref:MazG family protein n=1 Tax=Acetonema longum DSM 6540 TaxID=1009370 RepID=F7NH82_9FIRM|nr:nucleoside triphosphate pyrophosphohydrolase [Acetonema longum]EGO64565.1 MazG family protein [Acetonema longum DSM 6540]
MSSIHIVGLGPGPFHLITLATLTVLESGAAVLLRTARHPAVTGLAARHISYTSYDEYYEHYPDFDAVYQAIVQDVISRAQAGQNVVYAVPGSPLVAEKTVDLIRRQAREQGISLTVHPGMSFLELAYTKLDLDPNNGLMICDAANIAGLSPVWDGGILIAQVYSRQVASDLKLSLMESYPDDFELVLLVNLGLDSEVVRRVPLYELDRQPELHHLTSVYVPPYAWRSQSFQLAPLVDTMARLRSPGGCVWDIEQTHESLRRYMVEEVYEVLEAIELADKKTLCEELGDLLLQVVFHARIAEESGEFTMQDVIDGIVTKLVRRHPHVFGDISVKTAAEVVVNWDKIKQQEKGAERKYVLDGVPVGLPALMRAFKLQSKAAKVGFDWDSTGPVWDKLAEESDELKAAITGGNRQDMESEAGDLLFAVVNLARHIGVEPEVALTAANNKFLRRFRYIEQQLQKEGVDWKDSTLEKLDQLWNDAKLKETRK